MNFGYFAMHLALCWMEEKNWHTGLEPNKGAIHRLPSNVEQNA